MASVYLSSVDGADADNGSTWALADATLAASLTAAGNGGTSYMDSAHAETQASAMTLTSPGAGSTPVRVIGSDRTGNPEPPTALATGAKVTVTGNFSIAYNGQAYVRGVTFEAGTTGANNRHNFTDTTDSLWTLEDCELSLPTNNSAGLISVGGATLGDGGGLTLINSNVRFANAGHSIRVATRMRWRGGSLLGTAPTTLFVPAISTSYFDILLEGVDLSGIANSGAIIDQSTALCGVLRAIGCKLNGSANIATGTVPGRGGIEVELVNCMSGDTHYGYFKRNFAGTVTHEVVVVVTGGGSDGTTTLGRKFVTTAGASPLDPLWCPMPAVWVDTPGSYTATIEIINGDGTTFTDKEVWASVRYPGTSGFPLALFADDRCSLTNVLLGSGTAQTSSSVTWTNPAGTPVKQKCVVSFTTQEKGWVYPFLNFAKPSSTMYADFKATVA